MGPERAKTHLVLVVDDDQAHREAVQQVLAGALPVVVETAADGRAALEMAKARAYDLVLTDYQMPRMDGLELVRHLREASPGAARILMTAFTDARIAAEAITSGKVQAYLLKPVEPAHLIQTIREVLDERERRALKERGLDQAHRVFAGETALRGRSPPGRPFTGSLDRE